MKYRIFAIFLALCLALSILPAALGAETGEGPDRADNQCGEDIYWSFDKESGTLTFTGTGEMDDQYEYIPWEQHREEITTVVFDGKITYIGAHSFTDFDNLTQVDFGDSLREIGLQAFMDCDGLTSVTLPASFKVFGEECFRNCRNLKEFHCQGGFPSFRQNCLWNTYAVIYFPAERPWGLQYIQQLEEAFHGRIEFLASDGTDPYVPEGEDTDPTEESTEPTEESTEPTEESTEPTEESTEPTEESTEPTEESALPTEESTAATEAPTETAEESTQPTREPAAPRGPSSGMLIGGLIVVAVLALVAAGALAFRRR